MTEPLKKIFRSLGEPYAPRYSGSAASLFQTEICGEGLSKVLKADDPRLYDELTKLSALVEKLRTAPYTEDEVKRAMGEGYKPKEALAENVRLSYVLAERLEQSEENRKLVDSIRTEIENLLGKYGGAR